eukprot:TRINITY_DN12610_c0_g1_i1.p1 TRINITY_DN12610_c0_g1~~TRINITY_DN12610_c0_g1_i1.p1  ORF type:complete len:159 (+),score=62.96 TRINITY_DN12610_c0_g1_i1:78-554(+)
MAQARPVDAEEEVFVDTKAAPAGNFDKAAGLLEEIVMEEGFREAQDGFFMTHRAVFEDGEENKLEYTAIHREYVQLMEADLTSKLVAGGVDLEAFLLELQAKDRDDLWGDLWEMLFAMTDFRDFKEMILSYPLPTTSPSALPQVHTQSLLASPSTSAP